MELRKPSPSELLPQFKLRFPADLKYRLERVAKREQRSINGQIIKFITDGLEAAERAQNGRAA